MKRSLFLWIAAMFLLRLNLINATVFFDELFVDASGPVAAPRDQIAPSVALHAGGGLIIWQDYRSPVNPGRADIFGSRISSRGEVLDPLGLIISRKAAGRMRTIASGDEYLVAWQGALVYEPGIWAVRVGPDGAVKDSETIRVSTAAEDFRLASNGDSYLVVWIESENVYASILRKSGSPPAGPKMVVSARPVSETRPVASSDGRDYWVAWTERSSTARGGQDIFGKKISSTGDVALGPARALSETDAAETTNGLEFDGTHYVLAWKSTELFATRFDGNGMPVAGMGPMRISSDPEARLIKTPEGFAVVFGEMTTAAHRNIFATALGTGFEPGATVMLAHELPLTEKVSVSALGGEYVTVLPEVRGGGTGYDIYAWFNAMDGSAGREELVSKAPRWQSSPEVASNGEEYLVVWSEPMLGESRLMGRRFSQAGFAMDGGPVEIGVAPGGEPGPAVASVGKDFLVVWRDWAVGWKGARVLGGTGEVLPPGGVPIVTSQELAAGHAVGSDGTNYLVVTSIYMTDRYRAIGTLINAEGELIRTNLQLSLPGGHAGSPAVSSRGPEFMIVWETFGEELRGATWSGGETKEFGLGLRGYSGAKGLTIASNGEDYMVVSIHLALGALLNVPHRIWAARLDATGQIVHTSILSTNVDFSAGSTVEGYGDAFSRGDYWVFWDDPHDRERGRSVNQGRRLDRAGRIIESVSLPRVAADTMDDMPRIAYGRQGDFLIVRQASPNFVGVVTAQVMSTWQPISFVDGTVSLYWKSSPGKKYAIDFTDDLGRPSWSLFPQEITASGPTGTFVDSTRERHRFYRIREK